MPRSKKSNNQISNSRSSVRNHPLDYGSLESKLPLASFVVTGLGDDVSGVPDGVVTLREAVIAANTNAAFGDAAAGDATGDRITFDSSISGGTIELTEGQLSITDDLLVQGGGSDLTIDANDSSRHFEITTGERVAIGQLSMINGVSDAGGSIASVGGGNLLIVGANFSDNEATGVGGGAIFKDAGNLFVSADSNFMNNVASGDSGSGGAILSEAGVTAVAGGSFLSNVANRAGGAVEIVDGAFFATDVTMGAEGMGNIAGPEGSAAPGNGGAFHVTGAATIGIRGGTYTHNVAASEGGALWNQVNSNMFVTGDTTISNNVAAGNDADNGGGGIFNNGGNVVVRDAIISSNTANGDSGSGGGIFSTDGRILVIDSEISSNTSARAGGGVELIDGFIAFTDSLVTLNDTGVTLPAAPGNGGGFHVSGESTVIVAGTTFSENVAGREGGGLWNQVGSLMFINSESVISDNSALGDGADDGGGGVFNNGGDVTIVNSEISGNVASGDSGSGGGIFSTDGVVRIFSDSVVDSNSAARAGGGIEVIDGRIVVNDSTLSNNDAGVNVTAAPGNGGALHVTGNLATVVLSGATVTENAAQQGGGLWNQTDSLMFVRNMSVISNNTVDSSTGVGGGIYNKGFLRAVDSVFELNTTGGDGGAYFGTDTSRARIEDGTIRLNAAGDEGGAIFNDGNLSVLDSSFTGNTATTDGGAIFTGESGRLTESGNSFEGNLPNDTN